MYLWFVYRDYKKLLLADSSSNYTCLGLRNQMERLVHADRIHFNQICGIEHALFVMRTWRT